MNQQQPPVQETEDVWKGIGLAMLLNLIQIPLLRSGYGIGVAAIGITQLLYQLPAAIVCGLVGRPGMFKGVMIGAAITFLLSAAACFGVISGVIRLP